MRALFVSSWIAITAAVQPLAASALTVNELLDACDASQQPCQTIPWAQAYLGGGFDLIASLQEQTAHLTPIYCDAPRQVFDVPAVFAYLESHRDEAGDKNAMLMFVRYLEERGGC